MNKRTITTIANKVRNTSTKTKATSLFILVLIISTQLPALYGAYLMTGAFITLTVYLAISIIKRFINRLREISNQ